MDDDQTIFSVIYTDAGEKLLIRADAPPKWNDTQKWFQVAFDLALNPGCHTRI